MSKVSIVILVISKFKLAGDYGATEVRHVLHEICHNENLNSRIF